MLDEDEEARGLAAGRSGRMLSVTRGVPGAVRMVSEYGGEITDDDGDVSVSIDDLRNEPTELET